MLGLFGESVFLQFIAIAGVVLAAIYLYFQESFSYWKTKGVFSPKPTVPFGNFAKVFFPKKNPQFVLQDIYKEFEGERYVGLYRLGTPVLMVRDTELIKNIFVKDFDSFYSRGFKTNEKVEPLSGHLFALSGPKWRNLRIKLSPTFTSGKMKMMFPILVETGKELKKYLKEPADKKEVIEIKDVLARFSTDIIASCAFGIDCNCLKDPNAEFRQWGRRIFKSTFRGRIKRILIQVMPFLPYILPITFLSNQVSVYFRKMVRDTVEYREKNNVQRNDFMQLLIQLKNKTLGSAEDDPLLKTSSVESSGLKSNEPFGKCILLHFKCQ